MFYVSQEHAHAQRLKQKTGSPGKDTTEFSKPPNFESTKKLFVEVQRAVESKQLQPTLRTVYMRTAFQVPYDASVRCSLDTSLCMLGENPKGHPTCVSSNRWFRDPKIPVHRTDVTVRAFPNSKSRSPCLPILVPEWTFTSDCLLIHITKD